MYGNVEIAVKNGMLRKVFLYMFLGLFLTGAVMIGLILNPNIAFMVYRHPTTIMLVDLGLVFYINFRINKISSSTAGFLFFVYSAVNGLLLSSIMFIYTGYAILYVLAITMIIFVVMALYGYKTKEDLSNYSSFFKGALLTLIIVSVLNIFLKMPVIAWGISVFAIVLFTGLIAFDVNRIINIFNNSNLNDEDYTKIAIIGALMLYLDFINLFLNLLRIFGRKR